MGRVKMQRQVKRTTCVTNGIGDMPVPGSINNNIKLSAMKYEKVTTDDLKSTLSQIGIKDEVKQEKIITRLQVNGCLIAMVSDVLDSLIKDEEGMLKMLAVRYKGEQKMYRNAMMDAAKKFSYNMKGFTQHFFGTEINDNLEDNAQDIYDIIKLLADHTNDHKDMETIKRNLRKRKLNHHIFD